MKNLKKILRTTYAYTFERPMDTFKRYPKSILVATLITGFLVYYFDPAFTKPKFLKQNQNQEVQQYDPNLPTNNLENSLNNK